MIMMRDPSGSFIKILEVKDTPTSAFLRELKDPTGFLRVLYKKN